MKAQESRVVRLLGWLADSVCAHPQRWIWPQLILFAGCVVFTAGFLEFKMDRSDLVSAEDESHQLYLEFLKEFPLQGELVVVVESGDREKNRQFVERLGVKLESEPELFTDVFYKGDLRALGDKALLFIPEEDLRSLRRRLEEYRPFLNHFTQATNLTSFFSLMNRQIRTSRNQPEEAGQNLMNALPAIERIIDQAADSLARPGIPPSPGLFTLFGDSNEAEEGMYITFAEGRMYLVTVRPRSEEVINPAIERLRQLISETQAEVPGLNVGATGEDILEYDEMHQSQRDSTKASVVALMLCGFIFVFGYRETGRPIKAVFCLLIGLGYTMGFTTLTIGHLNILTITFVPILIGLAIDFGVHLITRYEEELRSGADEFKAMHRSMVETGRGIFSGALTTAGAFLAMGVAEFKGIREMGIICGGGILVSLVPMMTLLPALLLKGRQNRLDHFRAERPGRHNHIEKLILHRPWAVAGAGLLVTIAAILFAREVYFDYNLLNLQSKGLPAVNLSRKLIDSDSRSVLYGALVVDTLEEALRLEEELEQLPTVGSVNFGGIEDMSRYLTEDQTQKLELVRSIQQSLEEIEFHPVDTSPVEIAELSQVLYSFEGYMMAAAEEVAGERRELAVQLLDIKESSLALRKRMLNPDTPNPARKLALFQASLFHDIHLTFESLRNQVSSEGLRIQDLPESIRDRFVGVTGKYLLQIYPAEDVWEREPQERFVEEVRSVVPRLTGTPVEQYEYTTMLVRSYVEAALYSLGAILVLLAIHFRRPRLVLLSLVPVALGMVWMVGLMGVFGIPFNPANVMTLPLVVGIGVTNGIHILNRFVEEKNPGLLTKSTGKAVVVSGLTTMAGFSSLMLAQHQGILSLGMVMTFGVAACMVVGLTVLPAAIRLVGAGNSENAKPSDNETSSSLGREEPR